MKITINNIALDLSTTKTILFVGGRKESCSGASRLHYASTSHIDPDIVFFDLEECTPDELVEVFEQASRVDGPVIVYLENLPAMGITAEDLAERPENAIVVVSGENEPTDYTPYDVVIRWEHTKTGQDTVVTGTRLKG